jgi:hypothetical protein
MLNSKIQKLLDEFNNSPIVKYYEEKGERKASAAALSKLRMEYGLASKMAKASIKVGAHIKGNKAMREAGGHIKGGYVSIAQLLKWQKDTGYSIGKLKKTETHKKNIGISNICKVRTTENKNKIRETVNKFNSSLTKEQRSDKYSNNARARKAREIRVKILNSIRVKTFDSIRLRKACDRFDYDFDLLARDKTLIQRIHKGTNQNNPSIYKKINYENIYN